LGSDKGTFSQMYFVYLKKKARNQGTNFPGDAEGELCGVALILIFNKTLVFQAFYTQHTLRFAKQGLCERSVLHGFFNGAMRHCL